MTPSPPKRRRRAWWQSRRVQLWLGAVCLPTLAVNLCPMLPWPAARAICHGLSGTSAPLAIFSASDAGR